MQVKLWCQALACLDTERQDILAGGQRADREIGEAAGRRVGAVEIEGDFVVGGVLADQEARGGVGFAARGLVPDHEHRLAVFPVGGQQGDGVALVGEMGSVGQPDGGGGAALLVDGLGDGAGQGLPAGANDPGVVGGEVVEAGLPWQGQVADTEGGDIIDGMEFEEEGLVAELGEAGGGRQKGDRGGTGGCQGLGGGVDGPQMGGAGRELDLIVGGLPHSLRAGVQINPVGEVEPAILGLQGL